MKDFDKLAAKKEFAPYEKITTHAIEKDKKRKEDLQPETTPQSPTRAFAVLISHCHNIMTAFGRKIFTSHFEKTPLHLLDTVTILRELLHQLTQEDLSHDPTYTLKLSEHWHHLLDYLHPFSQRPQQELAPLASQILFFINQMYHYPPEADHSLGYYFKEYAGQDWIPFPFMELLQQLHRECKHSPEHNVLSHWISLLDTILFSFQSTKH